MKLVNVEREFALTRSSARKGALPKRGTGTVELIVNGTPVTAIVTSNAAWCGSPELTIEYVWIPDGDGKCYYVTLPYGELAASWAGAEVSVIEGTGPKVPPRLVAGEYKSVTEELEREAGRINKFRDTWAKRVA
jgi:hypothetical protein